MLNKIEKMTLNSKIKYKDLTKEIKADIKKAKPLFARVGEFAVSFDTNDQTTSKATKLSINSELVQIVKGLAPKILHTSTAQKITKASNNLVKKAIAIAICKNANTHYRKVAKCKDSAIYQELQAVACWSTINQTFFEIVTDFGANAILHKINGDIEIITPNKVASLLAKVQDKAIKEKADRKQAKANAKAQATEKAQKQAQKQAPQGEKKASTRKAKA